MGKNSLTYDVKEQDILVNDDKQYYSIKYASALMGVSPTTIRNYMKSGKLSFVVEDYYFGKMKFVSADDVENKINEKNMAVATYNNNKKMLVEVFQEQMKIAIKEENKEVIDRIELMTEEFRKMTEQLDSRLNEIEGKKNKGFLSRIFRNNERSDENE